MVSTLQDSVLKLKDVSNYKPCRGRLGAGRLREFSRAEETAEGVGSQARSPLSTWDETFVAACCGSGRCRQYCLKSGPPVSQSPSRTLCFHGLGKQTEGRSDKKVILLLKKKL